MLGSKFLKGPTLKNGTIQHIPFLKSLAWNNSVFPICQNLWSVSCIEWKSFYYIEHWILITIEVGISAMLTFDPL